MPAASARTAGANIAVLKDFAVAEAQRVEFRWEIFNLLNHANFGRPANSVLNAGTRNTATGLPNTNLLIGGAGQITSTISNARQLQFGLKLIF